MENSYIDKRFRANRNINRNSNSNSNNNNNNAIIRPNSSATPNLTQMSNNNTN